MPAPTPEYQTPETKRIADLANLREMQTNINTWSKTKDLKPAVLVTKDKKLPSQNKLQLIEKKYAESKAKAQEYRRLKNTNVTEATKLVQQIRILYQEIVALNAEPGVAQALTKKIGELEKPPVPIAAPQLKTKAAAQSRPFSQLAQSITPPREELIHVAKPDSSTAIQLYSEYSPTPEPEGEIAAIKKFCDHALAKYKDSTIDPKLINYTPDETVATIIANYRAYKALENSPRLTQQQSRTATPIHSLLRDIQQQTALLWQLESVPQNLSTVYKRILEKDRANEGAVTQWEGLQRQKHELTASLHESLKKRFLQNQLRDDRGKPVDLNDYFSTQIKILKGVIGRIDGQIDLLYQRGGMEESDYEDYGRALPKEYADRAAILAYQKIRSQHDQMLNPNIGVTIPKSREKLLNELIEIMASNKWPLMIGETGCGKTSFVKIIAHILTGKEHIQMTGKKEAQLREQIGSQQIRFEGDVKRSYYTFGPAMVALTGFYDSIEWETDRALNGNHPNGRLLFIDEGNEFKPDFLSSLLKPIERKRQGEKIPYPSELPPFIEALRTYGTGIIMAINPPGARYGRPEFRPTEERLFEGGKIHIPYLPIEFHRDPAKFNDELYQFLLANLMNNSGDMRVNPNELMPYFEANSEADQEKSKIKKFTLADETSEKHGVLLRFALAVGHMHKNFDGKPNIKINKKYADATETEKQEDFLMRSVLDMGTLRTWMEDYQNIANQNISLDYFLRSRLNNYYSGISEKYESDKKIIKKIFEEFGFNVDQAPPETPSEDPSNINFSTSLVSRTAIGYMLPSTPRHIEKQGSAPQPDDGIVFSDKGVLHFKPVSIKIKSRDILPNSTINYLGSKFIFKGINVLNENYVILVAENDSTHVITIPLTELK